MIVVVIIIIIPITQERKTIGRVKRQSMLGMREKKPKPVPDLPSIWDK